MLELKAMVRGEDDVYYPYRTAIVRGLLKIKCEDGEYRSLENLLINKTKKIYNKSTGLLEEPGNICPDNHT